MKHLFLSLAVALSLGAQAQDQPQVRESMWPLIECGIQHTLYPLGDVGSRHFDIKSEYKAKELLGALMNQAESYMKSAEVFPTATNIYTFYFADDHYVNLWENKEGSKAPGYFASGSTGVRLHRPNYKVVNGVLQ
mgnify:FL=1|tara:strand:+ start:263 stop:667 length:405 start_codon:yes stop_codon:yes gene_type:complete